METTPLSALSDHRITDHLHELRRNEGRLLVELLQYLGEVDRRRLYLEMAYPSLYAFTVSFLGYGKASAFRRTVAARLLMRFPIIGEYLADRRLNLTTLLALREVLAEDRLQEILDRASGQTEEQVTELVAALTARPPAVDRIRGLPTTCVLAAPMDSVSSGTERVESNPPVAQREPGGRLASYLVRVSPEHCVLRLTVSAEFARDLEAVRALLSHKIPDGNLAAVLHECLRMTRDACEKRRRGTGRARRGNAVKPKTDRRYIPSQVRDAVWRRDEGNCSFVSEDGRRCGSTFQLEIHHLHPFARGGGATVEGLALMCKAHNLHEARREFGDAHIERAIGRARDDAPLPGTPAAGPQG